MKIYLQKVLFFALVFGASITNAADYMIDTERGHASIHFKIKNLGFSWLKGRFNEFSGDFSFDPDAPENAWVAVEIDPASVDSNHDERDELLRGDDFLNVEAFPKAKFVSKRVEVTGDKKGKVYGELTLKGITKELVIDAELVGMGEDPWGGERVGFEGTTRFALKDFDILPNLGLFSQHINMMLHIEGVKKK